MKRIIIMTIMLLIGINAFSQGHLKFKGIDMGCTPKEMCAKLQQQGFKYLGMEEDSIMMEGQFFSQKANLLIVPSPVGSVLSVGVCYDVNESEWKHINQLMTSLQSGLTKKYGAPEENNRKLGMGYGDGSGHELYGFESGRSEWNSTWEVENGKIALQLSASFTTPTYIYLFYLDEMSFEALKQNAYDDL